MFPAAPFLVSGLQNSVSWVCRCGLPVPDPGVNRRGLILKQGAYHLGETVRLTVTTDDQELELAAGGKGEIRQVINGVVIKRRRVGTDEWLEALAAVLAQLAGRNAAARDALTRLLGA